MPSNQERTNRVQVRLSDSMFSRMKILSDDMGIPYSTLATVAVSEYVIRKEREGYVASSSVEAVKEVLADMVDDLPSKITQVAKLISEE